MELPIELRDALALALEGVSRTALSERAAHMSESYRSSTTSAHVIRDEKDGLAYAVTRMPATYAAVRNVLARLQERTTAFEPGSLLDLGAGPGTASWAAVDAWPALANITQIDMNSTLLDLGRKLATSAPPALHNAIRITGDFTPAEAINTQADLVILSYAIAELATDQIGTLLTSAWQHCSGALVIADPGTSRSYQGILQCRDLLLREGARILAPCPHEIPCPLVAPDWCHFTQRVPRSRDHRLVKSSTLAYEDEKFSYLIAVRENLFKAATADRILTQPSHGKVERTLKLCQRDGTSALVKITRRDATAFRRAKKKDWGDEF
ncbi:MAG TPA: small ribosomal subunit Rsm22 family protein [Terracidiphilus sp.]|jgi:ribosomal protein RSM22 (predicted rRNA methylase)|nr:small ribosomal subunit Rsm22 family protein [Terracidiphilus sp.]